MQCDVYIVFMCSFLVRFPDWNMKNLNYSKSGLKIPIPTQYKCSFFFLTFWGVLWKKGSASFQHHSFSFIFSWKTTPMKSAKDLLASIHYISKTSKPYPQSSFEFVFINFILIWWKMNLYPVCLKHIIEIEYICFIKMKRLPGGRRKSKSWISVWLAILCMSRSVCMCVCEASFKDEIALCTTFKMLSMPFEKMSFLLVSTWKKSRLWGWGDYKDFFGISRQVHRVTSLPSSSIHFLLSLACKILF